ncbi:anhydro-N-acetylmuramic acid kinase [Alteromonas sediminis]|uniref:Anhydro-N-acetylmuramic acid kinase n=1 Tax=Alteromonas sediminis TaxID=2259342 RepID=A0A3N5XZG3_9ALTE|nr:anhydro-N-acetylmuramic acid kinase [Alteromonas sediminis]RPJ65903.1 anhydro-N-acetylmuramic acid kinase [Alteromonas sediminis]
MLQHIQKLAVIAEKPVRRIVGLMSGTSLDGLDIALCEISGSGAQTTLKVTAFLTTPYNDQQKQSIKQVFAKKQVDLQTLCLLNASIGTLHGHMVRDALEHWQISADSIDLVASHGQTVFHAPRSFHGICEQPNATLQLGDGDHVARACGITTVCDFRQRQIAAGGEGAPLVVYGDNLLFSSETENRILLNIGGIANFTYLPAHSVKAAPYCTDVGPGNTLLDAYCQRAFNLDYDKDAKLASRGKVNRRLLDDLMSHSFFQQAFPKTTGPELFNLALLDAKQAALGLQGVSHEDILATLTQFSAHTICDAIKTTKANAVYVSGGGALNPLMMAKISEQLPGMKVATTDALGMDGNAKEAALFALLANECIAGNASASPTIAGMPLTSMGKICFPE